MLPCVLAIPCSSRFLISITLTVCLVCCSGMSTHTSEADYRQFSWVVSCKELPYTHCAQAVWDITYKLSFHSCTHDAHRTPSQSNNYVVYLICICISMVSNQDCACCCTDDVEQGTDNPGAFVQCKWLAEGLNLFSIALEKTGCVV